MSDPFSFQAIMDNMMVARRQEALKDSPQLTLGELILKLEGLQDRSRRIAFDFDGMRPTGVDSWRGSYSELALGYQPVGQMPVDELLAILKEAVGKTYFGYKGGEYRMGRHTPVWVANCGESGVMRGGEYVTLAVVDVLDGEDEIILQTDAVEY